MVFHHDPDGPHAPGDARTAQDDYGRYKRDCEDSVLSAYPEASVVRIGWQIDGEQAGNNMLVALDAWQREQGRVSASTLWRPACSFMGDTAEALVRLLLAPRAGVQHLDSNAVEGHTFYAIACALRDAFGREAWQVEPNQDYAHDQRLIGGLLVPPLSARLPALARQSA
jgi:dTDP-4-dehydrorhamnose reductase